MVFLLLFVAKWLVKRKVFSMYDFRDHGVNFGMSSTCPITLRSLLNMWSLSCADKIRASRHTSARLCRFTRLWIKTGWVFLIRVHCFLMFTAVPVPEAGFYCPNLAMNKYPRSNFIINNCGNYISENEEFSLIFTHYQSTTKSFHIYECDKL